MGKQWNSDRFYFLGLQNHCKWWLQPLNKKMLAPWKESFDKPNVIIAQSCPTLCDSMDCSPPGFSVHGILQARILEWVAMPSSRESSWPKDRTEVSCIAGGFFTNWAIREALYIIKRMPLSKCSDMMKLGIRQSECLNYMQNYCECASHKCRLTRIYCTRDSSAIYINSFNIIISVIF